MNKQPLLQVNDLEIAFPIEKDFNTVIHRINYQIHTNEIVGIVGESGSGKSISSLALMKLLPEKARIKGCINFLNQSILDLSEKEIRKIRGAEISMIFQEPMSSLNPSMKCGQQVVEVLQQHKKISAKQAEKEVISLFEKVKLPRAKSIFKSYPHQISGGQKQRVMIAMAIACKPKILIADEPTTALDVTVQNEILKLLKELQQETEMSILFISHDLGVVSKICDRVLVMYQGKIIEQNTASQVFNQPQELYTKALLSARPDPQKRLKKLPTVADFIANEIHFEEETDHERSNRHQKIYSQSPLLEVQNLSKTYFSKTNWWGKTEAVKAVDGVSFKIYEGETLGLVGESGCGKSTLGNLILRLDEITAGQVFYKGKDITQVQGEELRKLRKDIQLIFQDPFSSLNPRISVGRAILEPMEVHRLHKNNAERKQKAIDLLERVGLSADYFDRYPHEFSGGQRQRIGVARTIAVNPRFIICDESVSALDISVQAQVLNLLNELKNDFGFTYLFISHDLAVVKYMSDQLLVMNQGQIVESGEADMVYKQPKMDYTQKLIQAAVHY
ncbi:MAG: ABC transporter ATP-binding protein [Bacteroidota bacterium]